MTLTQALVQNTMKLFKWVPSNLNGNEVERFERFVEPLFDSMKNYPTYWYFYGNGDGAPPIQQSYLN